jgi:hypothetical protein
MTIPVVNTSEKPESWTATFIALILFLFLGLTFISMEIPRAWTIPSSLDTIISVLYPLQLVLYPTLFFIGWIKGFPRWSYPYLGIVLLFSFLGMYEPTLDFLFGDGLWGWRTWIALLIISVVALLVTRSFQPLKKFFMIIKEDWTHLTFGMYGCLPVYAMVSFDDLDRLYTLYFMVGLTVVMLSTVILYMRSSTQKQRIIILLIGTLLILAIGRIGPALNWLNSWTSYRDNIYQLIFLIMFSPALISIFRESEEMDWNKTNK